MDDAEFERRWLLWLLVFVSVFAGLSLICTSLPIDSFWLAQAVTFAAAIGVATFTLLASLRVDKRRRLGKASRATFLGALERF